MRRGVCVLVFLFLLGAVGTAVAQSGDPGSRSSGQAPGFQLEQNYPNPFNPETRIPFYLGPELFAEGKSVVVSVRIYNVLQQLVAIPTALRHSRGPEPVNALEYPGPGRYEAYWDGTNLSGRGVASGVYFMELTVNRRSQVRKMVIAK
ncbi:MAG: hypothetical protein HY701_02725 [Gemmatimonadetes bacterium]|nr:hypothetical protein [Gemmatimonadota bacterium]